MVVTQLFYLPSDGVWAADNSRLRHRRVLNQGTFYLKWSNPVTGKGDRKEFIEVSSRFPSERRPPVNIDIHAVEKENYPEDKMMSSDLATNQK